MKKIIGIIIAVVSLASCSTTTTLSQQYPGMYEEKPLTIAIMPPINQTTHAEAKDYFYTTMYMPLCEKGYYVYSPYMTMEMFQQESAYDAEMFLEADLTPFRNILDADAAMFTIIKDWKKSSIIGMMTVKVEYILRSTKSGQTLYNREGEIKVDTSVEGQGLGALVGMIATVMKTATTDKVVAGRKCTAFVLSDLPAGKYSPMHAKDASKPAGKKFIKATVK
ncbi:MAG: DUF799 family lipoprotein [Muribaculaceae bacterium]|nr:DUF799 family lipoprotein [Muribaculaceae bacterium]